MALLLSHRLANGLVAPAAYHRISAVEVAVHRHQALPAEAPARANAEFADTAIAVTFPTS